MIRFMIWFILTSVALLSAFVGAVHLDIYEILVPNTLSHTLFFDLRVPRVIFTFFAGATLAMSGLLFQTLFRNSLMTPYTLGISSGAVLGAGIAIKLSLGTLFFGLAAISIFGFFGALFTIFLLLYLSRFLPSSSSDSLLLLGIALSFFYTSALMILFYLGDAMQNDMLMRFTMGSLSILGWSRPIVLATVTIILLVALYIYRYELQLISLSQSQAKLKGVDTKKVTLKLLIVSSLAIGTLVSISGPIGFVGLLVPHIITKLYPLNLVHRILKSAIFGGLFLIFCDTIARTIDTQSELPIGIVTAIVGAPFFIYLIITKASR